MFPSARRARIVAVLLVGGVAAVALAAEAPTVTKENAFSFYRGFKRLTETPRYVSMQLAVMCAMPSKEMVAREEREKGPHAQARIHLYVDPSAENTVNERRTVFPPGAIVIKEKLGSGNLAVAVGGMIKHPPGYDPKNGDWEYFYCEKDGAPTSGKLANCATCHAGAKATDYVFSVWNPDRAPE